MSRGRTKNKQCVHAAIQTRGHGNRVPYLDEIKKVNEGEQQAPLARASVRVRYCCIRGSKADPRAVRSDSPTAPHVPDKCQVVNKHDT